MGQRRKKIPPTPGLRHIMVNKLMRYILYVLQFIILFNKFIVFIIFIKYTSEYHACHIRVICMVGLAACMSHSCHMHGRSCSMHVTFMVGIAACMSHSCHMHGRSCRMHVTGIIAFM